MASARDGFRFVDDNTLSAEPPPPYLVQDILPSAALGVLAGAPGSAKTFFSLDVSLSVASGLDWLGRYRVEQGTVVYVAAEGGRGLGLRVDAWKGSRDIQGAAGVYFLCQPVHLHVRGEPKRLIEAIQESLPVFPSLVIIDTLSRCFLGGDENSAREMGLLVAGMDAIREKGTAVLALHHTGHSNKSRERGSSALRAAADMAMTITCWHRESGLYTVHCEKQKDDEPFGDLRLKLRRQVVRDGEESRVFELLPHPSENGPISSDDLGRRAARALEALVSLGAKGATHGEWLKASSLSKATFNRALSDLLERRLVYCEGKRYFPKAD